MSPCSVCLETVTWRVLAVIGDWRPGEWWLKTRWVVRENGDCRHDERKASVPDKEISVSYRLWRKQIIFTGARLAELSAINHVQSAWSINEVSISEPTCSLHPRVVFLKSRPSGPSRDCYTAFTSMRCMNGPLPFSPPPHPHICTFSNSILKADWGHTRKIGMNNSQHLRISPTVWSDSVGKGTYYVWHAHFQAWKSTLWKTCHRLKAVDWIFSRLRVEHRAGRSHVIDRDGIVSIKNICQMLQSVSRFWLRRLQQTLQHSDTLNSHYFRWKKKKKKKERRKKNGGGWLVGVGIGGTGCCPASSKSAPPHPHIAINPHPSTIDVLRCHLFPFRLLHFVFKDTEEVSLLMERLSWLGSVRTLPGLQVETSLACHCRSTVC